MQVSIRGGLACSPRGVHCSHVPPDAQQTRRSRKLRALAAGATVWMVAVGCEDPERASPAPTYRDDVRSLLGAKCARCHDGDAPAGGFRATSFVDAIGCDATRITRALATSAHASVLEPAERAVLDRWISAGAPASRGGVHSSTFADPRAPDSHGRFLRARRYRPMTDANDLDACSSCHEGAPARAAGRLAAPGAPACTSCHTKPGEGPLACDTCHGAEGRAHPPRNACFFPDDRGGAHAAHLMTKLAEGIACATCHPTPTLGDFSKTHGDGHVEVWFDRARAGNGASFDPVTGACATRCHAGPGALMPSPKWSETTKLDCRSCHGSPPPDHPNGGCTSCHRGTDATGTTIIEPKLHVNGRVDLGDGSGTCGACHGTGADPWPTTGAHAKHAKPSAAAPVVCTNCHAWPEGAHPSGTGRARVRLAELAAKGGRAPTYDPATKTCAGTYCHHAPGAALPAPRWDDMVTCGSCHAIPPSAPHTQSTGCGTTSCHLGVASGSVITAPSVHVDGIIDLSVP